MKSPEFYVGYLPRAGERQARFTRAGAVLALLGVACAALLLAGAHALRPAARFEYGSPVELTGTLTVRPFPRLALTGPLERGGQEVNTLTLVAPFKHGADELVAGFDRQVVRLRATLAERDGVVIGEIEPGSIQTSAGPSATREQPAQLGEVTLRGEVVDSKCFFGVMNPGELKPHRACAARCISGGIPPVLCVRDAAGSARYYWLLSPLGEPINQAVLDFVAEPLEVRGEVRSCAGQLWLYADPARFRRLP
jgi:hypothetical protein